MSGENVEFARSVFRRWNAGERDFPDEEIKLLRFETFIDDPADALRAAGLAEQADLPGE